ncbi:MAG TPA: hypothetical protein VJ995_00605 [Geothermobacteraceae bacterium]|nr:hypothetical protein [Geothermobacteraceae bacterium]
MGWFGLLVLVALVVFGWFAFRELKLMETDILRDIEAKNAAAAQSRDDSDEAPSTQGEASAGADPSLDGQLARLISERPGLVQTEIYSQLSGLNRKHIQQALLELDRRGVVRREKHRGSYRVFPG